MAACGHAHELFTSSLTEPGLCQDAGGWQKTRHVDMSMPPHMGQAHLSGLLMFQGFDVISWHSF